MSVIRKKSYPPYFEQVLRGEKKFDLRLCDFDVTPGDTIIFEEYDPATRKPTGRASTHRVGYVLNTRDLPYWSAADVAKHGFVIMQLENGNGK
jgi:hypothetical protein